MLILDIARICSKKGIDNASVWLRRQGFHSSTITAIMRRESSRLTYDQLGKICIALHCTPNDLFSWQPDKDLVVAPNHPMRTLLRTNKPGIAGLLHALPPKTLSRYAPS